MASASNDKPEPPPSTHEGGHRIPVRKDNWDKARIIITATVPAIIALLGVQFNATLKTREVQAEYVDLAIQILRDADTTIVSKQLRVWAGEILDELGPIPMPESLRQAITSGETRLPAPPDWAEWARLTLTMGPTEKVVLDGGVRTLKRGVELGGGEYVTRVRPGMHELVWLTWDGEVICRSERTYSPHENVKLRCDRSTGSVSIEIADLREEGQQEPTTP